MTEKHPDATSKIDPGMADVDKTVQIVKEFGHGDVLIKIADGVIVNVGIVGANKNVKKGMGRTG